MQILILDIELELDQIGCCLRTVDGTMRPGRVELLIVIRMSVTTKGWMASSAKTIRDERISSRMTHLRKYALHPTILPYLNASTVMHIPSTHL